MEQGDLEGLLQSLPNDLAEFVSEDNNAFREEKTKWDKEAEEKQLQLKMEEENAKKGADGGNSDVQVGRDQSNTVISALSHFYIVRRYLVWAFLLLHTKWLGT